MTAKGIIAVSIIGLILFLLLCLGIAMADSNANAVLLTFVLGLIAAVASILFKPFRTKLEDFVRQHIMLASQECRILIIGIGRSGKTSIIRKILTIDPAQQETSTMDFKIYRDTVRLGLKHPKHTSVAIADYQGQKVSQITIDHHLYPDFFGQSNQRLVDAVIFVVDMFPEIKDQNDKVISDDDLIKMYSRDAEKRIGGRVARHLDWIDEKMIEQILSLVLTGPSGKHNVICVKLLINKSDILKRLVELNYIAGVTTANTDKFVQKVYEPLIKNVKEAFNENGISDFSFHLVNTRTDDSVRRVFGEIIEMYHQRKVP